MVLGSVHGRQRPRGPFRRLPLRAWHRPVIAVLPAPAHWMTFRLNATWHDIFPVMMVTVVLAGEEPGEEEHREDQYDEYDNGDKACPDPPVCSLGRIGLRGRSYRFVSGLQWLGRTFITGHAAVLPSQFHTLLLGATPNPPD